MNYEEIAKKLGLDVAEKLILEVVIPYLEEQVEKSDNDWDDALLALAKPTLVQLADKLNGVDDIPDA